MLIKINNVDSIRQQYMLHTWYFPCYDINRERGTEPDIFVAIQLAQDIYIHAQRCDDITYLRSKLCLDTDQFFYNISCLK